MSGAKTSKAVWLLAIPLLVLAIVATVLSSTTAQAGLDDSAAAKSRDYTADMQLASLSVALQENGVTCAQTNEGASSYYDKLLADLNGGKALAFGKLYPEELSALNDGTQDEYVRVVVNKYWKAGDSKVTDLDPSLIKIKFDTDNWIVVDEADAPEQVILYSKQPIAPSESLPFVTNVGISADILALNDVVEIGDGSYVTAQYKYDSFKLGIDVEVSGVQARSIKDAMKSAWGIDIDDVHGTGQSIEVVS